MPHFRKTLSEKKEMMKTWLPILLCWFAYTTAYLGRFSYSSNINPIIEDLGINHATAGLVTTLFFIAYGAGQLVNGMLCRRYNKRVVIALSLILAAICNIIFYVGIPFEYVKYLWLINGLVQSTIWSTMIYLLSITLEKKDLKKAIVFMTSSVAAGTFISYGLSSVLSIFHAYKLAFLVGAFALLFSAVLWFCLYTKAFKSDKQVKEEEQKTSTSKSPVTPMLIATIVALSIFAVIHTVIKDSLTNWLPSILYEKFGLKNSLSIFLTLFLPLLGMFGAKLNIILRKYVKSFITMSGIWFAVAVIFIDAVILFINTSLWPLIVISFALINLVMFSVNNLVTSMTPLYMRDEINAGFLSGLLNTFACVGVSLSSYGIGAVADFFGWNGVLYLLLILCIVSILIAMIMSAIEKKQK